MPEYDFSNAKQGTHFERYRAGVSVVVTDDVGDQSAIETISLDEDVRVVFRDSAAVNKALRMLIETAKNAQELLKAS